MNIRLTFKTPDVVDDAVRRYMQEVDEDRELEIEAACAKWIRYGEYLTVEIDTETGTCTPIPAK